ncbi:hypothetical protein WJ60_09125 [Burkholderia ubonensis]|nr:hypothetical protein WJ60_09125 [Burkholderia ubonensis]
MTGNLGSSTASALGGGATYNPATGTISAPAYTTYNANGTTSTVNNVGAAIDDINSQGIKYFHANSTAPDSQALGTNSVAIGPNAAANNTGDVALGSGSVTAAANPTATGTIGGVTYNYAGTMPSSVVSVGAPGAERQVTNVAAGQVTATSTDAINGSQLFATNTAIDSLSTSTSTGLSTATSSIASLSTSTSTGIGSLSTGLSTATSSITSLSTSTSTAIVAAKTHYYSVNDNGTQQGNYNNDGATGINALAAGTNATAAGASAVALGDGANANSGGAVAIGQNASATGGQAVSIGVGNTANGDGAVAIGDPNTATGTGAIAMGANNTSNGQGAVALGNANTAIGQGSVALGNTSTANGAGSVAMGSGAIANNPNDVALGSGSVTAAANPTATATINGTTYTLAGTTPTSVVSVGAPGAERQITNVAAGHLSATSTDAVNGSQLYATDQAVDSLGATVGNIVNGGGIKYFHANSTLPDSQALGLNSVAIGPNAVANNAGDVALGFGATTAAANPTASAAIGGVTYNFAGVTPVSVVSVGAPGAERQITNVAAGQVTSSSTDAINGSQLYSTIQAINSLSTSTMTEIASLSTSQGGSSTLITSLSTSITRLSTATVTGSGSHYYSVNDGGVQQGNYGNNGATGSNAMAIGPNALASGANGVALGNGASANADGGTVVGASAVVSASDGTAIGHGAAAMAAGAVAIGHGAAAMAAGAVAIGANSVATEANTVSVGAPGSERRITNVAAGVNPTDAVNVSQLGAVQSSVNNVARTAYAGIAAATALTMIPEVDAGKTIAVGIGSSTYQGYSAVAIGFTARLTDNLKLKGGVSGGSAGHTYGIGASYQW